jgi:hypothetical protein
MALKVKATGFVSDSFQLGGIKTIDAAQVIQMARKAAQIAFGGDQILKAADVSGRNINPRQRGV